MTDRTQTLTVDQVAAITYAHLDLKGSLELISKGQPLAEAIEASITDLERQFPFLSENHTIATVEANDQ